MLTRREIVTRSFPLERSRYVLAIAFGLLGAVLYVAVRRFVDSDPRPNTDFDIFYLVGRFVLRGEVAAVYQRETFEFAQRALDAGSGFMPWAYPPPFNLIVAPLALIPIGAAYAVFVLGTLAAFLLLIRALAAGAFTLLFVLFFPGLVVTIACGQNGFLTGSMVALTGLLLTRGRKWAGVPVGLLIIKPHLAAPLALFALTTKDRVAFILGALATVLVSLAAATIFLGLDIWPAFLGALRQSSLYLNEGAYKAFRMVSPFATLQSLGAPISLAWVGQLASASFVLVTVWRCARADHEGRRTLGLAASGALLVSPYAYDYDLPVYMAGVALLVPDIGRYGRSLEKIGLYVLTFMTATFGLVQSRLEYEFVPGQAGTLAGLSLTVSFIVLWRIAGRRLPEEPSERTLS